MSFYAKSLLAGSILALVFASSCANQAQIKTDISEDTTMSRSPIKVDEAIMKAAMQQYIDGFKAGDAEMLYSLFADNARIEDPVGGGNIVEGKEAIRAFYEGAVKVVDRLELEAPIRSSYSNAAAMPFVIYFEMDGEPTVTRAIDVMTFNEDGKIIDMKAYHGPSDASAGR